MRRRAAALRVLPPALPDPPPAADGRAAPRPVESPQIHDPDGVALLRRVLCRRYDECLAYAVARDWAGFSCWRCPAYEAPTPEDFQASLPREADVLAQEPQWVR